MSKPQIWIIAATVGAVAIIVGIKHFGGSANEDDTASPQRLAQRDAKTEHGGWSVRSNSQDLPSSDDVKVQRQAEAKPRNIAPPRRNQPIEPQGGQPAAGAAPDEKPAPPSNGGALPPANAGSGAPNGNVGAIANAGGRKPDAIDTTGEVIQAPSAPQAAAGSLAAGSQGAAVVPPPEPGTETQAGGTEQNPTPDQHTQPTPPEIPTPAEVTIGAFYDSKDTKFSMDTPVEVKDIGTIPGTGVTMMAQLTPDWGPDSQDDADFLKLGDNLELTKNVHFLRLQYTDSNGHEYSIGTDMTQAQWEDIQPPYSIAATVNGNQMSLVVNGKVVRQATLDGMNYESPPNPALHVGCWDYPASRTCAPTGATGVMVLPPISKQESIARTKPPQPTGQ